MFLDLENKISLKTQLRGVNFALEINHNHKMWDVRVKQNIQWGDNRYLQNTGA